MDNEENRASVCESNWIRLFIIRLANRFYSYTECWETPFLNSGSSAKNIGYSEI